MTTTALREQEVNATQDGDVAPDSDTISVAPIGVRTLEYDCGHTGPWEYSLTLYGHPMPILGNKKMLCPVCLMRDFWTKQTIRCAICGHYISPGMPVVLYCRTDSRVKRESATLSGGYAVGCMLNSCGDSATISAPDGHWSSPIPCFVKLTPQGEIRRPLLGFEG